MVARHKLKAAAKAVLTVAAVGMAARAVRGGVSGEETVERREEFREREPYMRLDEKERLGALPEENIEREIARLVEGANKSNVEALVQRFDAVVARFEEEQRSGRVSEATLGELKLLPDQIRQEIGLSTGKLDELRGKVGRNIMARELRKPEVVREHERSYDVQPSLANRVGNILLGTPSTLKHVHSIEATVAVPDTLPTIEQLTQEHKLSLAGGELSGAESKVLSPSGELLHAEGNHAREGDSRDGRLRRRKQGEEGTK